MISEIIKDNTQITGLTQARMRRNQVIIAIDIFPVSVALFDQASDSNQSISFAVPSVIQSDTTSDTDSTDNTEDITMMPSTTHDKTSPTATPNKGKQPQGATPNTTETKRNPTAMLRTETGDYVQAGVRQAAAWWEQQHVKSPTTEYKSQPVNTHEPDIPNANAATTTQPTTQLGTITQTAMMAIADGQ